MTTTLRVMTFNVRGFYRPDDGANVWEKREAPLVRKQRQDRAPVGNDANPSLSASSGQPSPR